MNITEKRLNTLLRHITNVRENCEIVGKRLIELGRSTEGLELIARGQIHDNSKFYGIQWLYLHSDVKEHNPEMFKQAVLDHVQTNSHHPEYHLDGIHGMTTIELMEFTCDVCARSAEFGQDVNDWLEEKGFKKFNFTKNDEVYEIIEFTIGLLFEKAFI